MAFIDDDSDMKIVGAKSSFSSVKDYEYGGFEREKQNGNIAKARKLGVLAADQVDAGIAETDKNDDYLSCRKVLMIFSVVSTFENAITNKLLASTALNIFYDILKKENPLLYDQMSTSGASTFYYLALRRGGNVDENVGKAFAMLCDKDADPQFIDIGKHIYSFYTKKARALVESADFTE